MGKITEQNVWNENIYSLELDDPVIGGTPEFVGDEPVTGFANVSTQQLANRSLYLKNEVEDVREIAEEALYTPITGMYTVKTLAELQAIVPEAGERPAGRVTEDGANTGLYLWTGTEWEITVDPVDERIKYIDSPEQVIFQSSDSSTVVVYDEKGEIYAPNLNGKSVQQNFQDVKTDINEIKEDMTSEYQYSPAILTLTNAQKAVLQIQDEKGDIYIPGMSGLALGKRLDSLQRSINNLYEYHRIFDAVKDFGISPNGKSPVGYQIQAAIDNIKTLYGGGTLFFPAGIYLIEFGVKPRNGVHIVGAGWGRTIFMPMRNRPAFYNQDSDGWLEDCLFMDIEIDGSLHTEQNVADKGFFLRHYRRCFFIRNFIHDTGATGMGCDFVDGSYILDGRYVGNGRLSPVGAAGSSGIGVGSGVGLDEPTIVSRNFCDGNKNYGIFFEQQRTTTSIHQSRQVIITSNVCQHNQHGIGDCGLSGAIITGNQLNDNLGAGFAADSGTLTPDELGRPQPGNGGIFSNNQVLRNGLYGVHYDARKVGTLGGYKISDNRICENLGNGIMFESGTNLIPDMSFSNNDVSDNAGFGLDFNSGQLSDVDITTNKFLRNIGIAVRVSSDVTITSGRMFGNVSRDTQVTPTQTQMLAGTAVISNFDVFGNQYVGPSPTTAIDLPNIDPSTVTISNNPGVIL